MKTILKIGLGLAAAFFIFFAGLSLGFAGGTFSASRYDRTVNDRVVIERDIDRFVEDIVVEDMNDFETEIREFEVAMEEFEQDMEAGAVVIERNGRFGRDITVIPPVPPVPEIPAIPDVPAVPVVIHHGPPRLFALIGGMVKMIFAVAFILIGVWLIVRRNRQPVEKSPKM